MGAEKTQPERSKCSVLAPGASARAGSASCYPPPLPVCPSSEVEKPGPLFSVLEESGSCPVHCCTSPALSPASLQQSRMPIMRSGRTGTGYLIFLSRNMRLEYDTYRKARGQILRVIQHIPVPSPPIRKPPSPAPEVPQCPLPVIPSTEARLVRTDSVKVLWTL